MGNIDKLVADIVEDGKVDAREVSILRETLYADGVIDREEALALFKINDAVSGNDNDPAWKKFFVKAVGDHVLADDESPGVVDDDEAAFLIDQIRGDGRVDDVELALLVRIVSTATSCTDAFNAFVLDALETAVLEDGVIDDAEVDMIRAVVFGTGGGGGTAVDRDEADFLFRLNDGVSGNANCAAWATLFVDAIASHVLEDEASPGAIDEGEAAWLIERIEGDGQYDDIEKQLLARIKAEATSIPDDLAAMLEAAGA